MQIASKVFFDFSRYEGKDLSMELVGVLREKDFVSLRVKGGTNMSVNATTNVTNTTVDYTNNTTNTVKQENTSAKQEVKQEAAVKEAVTYEKTQETDTKATYKVNKMSVEEREALVDKLKADQEARKQSLISLVQGMMSKQTETFGVATGDDSIWKFLASGKYEVDAETKAKAQADIAEDGYYGVKQTSERLFDFASALAGDDVEKMKEMQAAMEKGYKMAEKTWGGELPEISKKTLEAANKLFEDYYASKKQVAVEDVTKDDTTIVE